MAQNFSAYMSIFNDWEILPHALRSVASYVDELVVVDGAYQWMAPFLNGIGRDLAKSADQVYDALEASGINYRVVSGIWKNEFEKRKAGYSACRHRYVFRIDADEVYFINEANLERFITGGGAVGEMEFPLYLAPGWILTHDMDRLERQSFLFDSMQIGADDHLHYLWLIDKLPQGTIDRRPVFSQPLSITAHLTGWRTPETSINRAAFYVLNHFRHHGVPWFADLTSRPLDDLSRFFAHIPASAFLDSLKNHAIVVGNEQLQNRFLRPSPLTESDEAGFASLFETFLSAQASNNAELASRGRHALGEVHLDVTSDAGARAISGGRDLTLACVPQLAAVQASVRYLIAQEPWEIVHNLPVELDGTTVRIELPFANAEPNFIRRFLTFQGWTSGDPLLRFSPVYGPLGSPSSNWGSEYDIKLAPFGATTGGRPMPAASLALANPKAEPSEVISDQTIRDETAELGTAVVRDETKIRYLHQIRREYIDPITSHPLYNNFVEFLKSNETDPHYPRYALTMAEMLNVLPDLFSQRGDITVCETGSLSLISLFLSNRGWRVRDTQADLRYSIDAEDASVDLLFSLEVLEHIKDQHEASLVEVVLFTGTGARKYVDEIQRVVKPGGFVVLTSPNPAGLSALLNLINYEPPVIYRPHVREYTKSEIIELFKGFDLVKYCAFFAYAYLGNGPEIAKSYAERLGWNPDDRGDCHFFVFRKQMNA